MTIRDLMPFGKSSVPVTRGASPMSAFQAEMNKLFDDFFAGSMMPGLFDRSEMPTRGAFDFAPAVDVKENANAYLIIVDVPGIDAKDVNVTVADGYVTIKGEKKAEAKEEKEGYFRQERSYGSFQRIVAMPETANLEKADATVKDGVLTIEIPKKAEAQAKQRKLEIKSAA